MARIISFSVKKENQEDIDWIEEQIERGKFHGKSELLHYLVTLGRREENDPNHLSHEMARIERKIKNLEERKEELEKAREKLAEKIEAYKERKKREKELEKERERRKREEEKKKRRELVEKVESEPDLAEKLRETGDPEKVVDEFREADVRIGTLELSKYLEIKGKRNE